MRTMMAAAVVLFLGGCGGQGLPDVEPPTPVIQPDMTPAGDMTENSCVGSLHVCSDSSVCCGGLPCTAVQTATTVETICCVPHGGACNDSRDCCQPDGNKNACFEGKCCSYDADGRLVCS